MQFLDSENHILKNRYRLTKNFKTVYHVGPPLPGCQPAPPRQWQTRHVPPPTLALPPPAPPPTAGKRDQGSSTTDQTQIKCSITDQKKSCISVHLKVHLSYVINVHHTPGRPVQLVEQTH